ncbi:MAG: hypothetical protein EP336_10395 [Rhodobacteraceae bacterium]|nr:MAG: hypothetical protein EP336_10395 [Paracoccaceae bacterium]
MEPTAIYDDDGVLQKVACRKCWQCRANRVNDLVGRCIAEDQYSTKTLAVTLTYADTEENAAHAATLVYSDFQKFMKRLRFHGYDVRYVVAGEYGSKKARAHWHAILFFRGKHPEVEINQRVSWSYWPHGMSYFQEPDYYGFHYILKYVLKDATLTINVGHLGMSKKPPIGHDFFQDRARRYVEQGLAPQSFLYSFDHVFDKKGKRRKFFIQGKTRENFLTTFEHEWRSQYDRDPPFSDILDDYWDAIAREEIEDFQDEYEDMRTIRERKYGPIRFGGEADFWFDDEDQNQLNPSLRGISERMFADVYAGEYHRRDCEPLQVILFFWDDETLTYKHGDYQWHESDPEKARDKFNFIRKKRHLFKFGFTRPKPMPSLALRPVSRQERAKRKLMGLPLRD